MTTNHITTVTSDHPAYNGLTLGIIDIHRKNRPQGLKKPYEYIVDHDVNFEERLSKIFKQHNCKYKTLKIRPIKFGYKIELWMLSYEDETTKAEWEKLIVDIQELLTEYLGPDAVLYSEPYARKFQLRFETAVWTAVWPEKKS